MQQGSGPQALKFLGRGAPPEHLVSVWVTPEALHELDPSPRLQGGARRRYPSSCPPLREASRMRAFTSAPKSNTAAET